MKPFGYARDALCLSAIAFYALNRWGLKPQVHGGILHDHFNDVLLIPAALPLVLGVQRLLKWRDQDGPPTPGEITLHLVIWSFLCEVAGPRFVDHATADWWDVVAYLTGGLLAGLWWQRDSAKKKVISLKPTT
ncbi:MAG: hypothetical protein J6386_07205 [Candidatus Synoicihabitans palmerolidicus]|nr:hypothetical protein [Candidatus Synoicihabitans palmerolidicus]